MTIAMIPRSPRPLTAAIARPAATAAADLRRRHLEARYRRRRTGAGLLVAGLVGAGALVADSVLTGPGGVPASAAGAGTARSGGAVVRARAGDSLWSIAEERRGNISITRYVEALIDLNGGTAIEVDQLVRLP